MTWRFRVGGTNTCIYTYMSVLGSHCSIFANDQDCGFDINEFKLHLVTFELKLFGEI